MESLKFLSTSFINVQDMCQPDFKSEKFLNLSWVLQKLIITISILIQIVFNYFILFQKQSYKPQNFRLGLTYFALNLINKVFTITQSDSVCLFFRHTCTFSACAIWFDINSFISIDSTLEIRNLSSWEADANFLISSVEKVKL